MDLKLRDRVVVITGGSAGIGRQAALTLAREGASLAVGARGADGLADLEGEVKAAGGQIVTVAGDLVTQEGVDRLIAAALDTYGKVDGLATCVGSTPLGDFDELTDDVWARAFEMKFMATVRAVRGAVGTMRDAGVGRIVLVAGNTAHGAIPWMATSGAMNAALVNLANNLAVQYGPAGIGVTCVNPGPTRTARYEGMHAAVREREGLDDAAATAWIAEQIPDRQVGEPEDVAALIAFLFSPSAAHISGTSVVVDGAQTTVR